MYHTTTPNSAKLHLLSLWQTLMLTGTPQFPAVEIHITLQPPNSAK